MKPLSAPSAAIAANKATSAPSAGLMSVLKKKAKGAFEPATLAAGSSIVTAEQERR